MHETQMGEMSFIHGQKNMIVTLEENFKKNKDAFQ